MLLRIGLAALSLSFISAKTFADAIPACALSGSKGVFINGKQALRLSDVKNCPPELYEINKSMFIDGEPTVFFKGGKSDKTTCGAMGSMNVIIEGRQANSVGDVRCKTAN